MDKSVKMAIIDKLLSRGHSFLKLSCMKKKIKKSKIIILLTLSKVRGGFRTLLYIKNEAICKRNQRF